MKYLESHLGRVLKVKDVAEYTGLDSKTIRKYYKKFGGIRVGSRFLFFEQELVNAIQNQADDEEIETEDLEQRNKTTSNNSDSGSHTGQSNTRRKENLKESRHGIF